MASPKRILPPENRSPEVRPLSKPLSPAILNRPVWEIPPPPPPAVPFEVEDEKEEVPLSPAVVPNRSIRDEIGVSAKVEPGAGGRPRVIASILSQSRREAIVRKADLGFRVVGLVFCFISFCVMASDKSRGWAEDSFQNYKEYRYCISVTVIGFVYSGFQAYVQAQHVITGKHVFRHHLRHHFDFILDQVLAYLLMSASSSAATRTEYWILNWGEDDFPKMAKASIGMSFLAFIAFAFNALISGYILCNPNS